MKKLTISEIQRSIPRECFKISKIKAWATLLRILGMLCLFVWIESLILLNEHVLWKLPLLIIVWLLHGQVLVGLFVLGHDCGHNSFSRNRIINLIVGHLCFSPLGNGLVNWTITHNHHHKHTQLKGQDVDWSSWLMTKEELGNSSWRNNFPGRLGYLFPFGLFFWVWLNSMKRGLVNTRPSVRISNLLMWIVMLSLYGLLWYNFDFFGMLKYHGMPAFIAMISGYYLLTIQHANEKTKWFEEESWSPVRGQMESTFDVRFPLVLEWLWLDINIHTPHHVAPNIPWYFLKRAGRSIKLSYPQLYQERKFSLAELRWMIKTPSLEYNPREKCYILSNR